MKTTKTRRVQRLLVRGGITHILQIGHLQAVWYEPLHDVADDEAAMQIAHQLAAKIVHGAFTDPASSEPAITDPEFSVVVTDVRTGKRVR